MNRIPPKGTDAYRHYWRDRRIKDEIARVIEMVEEAHADTESGKDRYYGRALLHLENAHKSFNAGWLRGYL